MFKKGDIVIVKKNTKGLDRSINEKIGKVIVESYSGDFVGIDFGKGFFGHDLDGKSSKNNCWWVEKNNLKKYKNSNLGCY